MGSSRTARLRAPMLLSGGCAALLLATCRQASTASDPEPSVVDEVAPAPSPSFPRAPSPAEPVVAAGTVEPSRVKPGETVSLAIHVRTAPAWHIYAHDARGTSNRPTELALELPAGIAAVEEWRHPPSHPDPASGVPVLEGTFVFRRELSVQPSAGPGERELVCEIAYQACDPFMCRPPERLEVRVPVVVVAR